MLEFNFFSLGFGCCLSIIALIEESEISFICGLLCIIANAVSIWGIN